MWLRILSLSFCILAAGCAGSASQEGPPRSAEEILQSYVEDFRSDPAAAEPWVFGIVVAGSDQSEWHIDIPGRKDEQGQFEVELKPGLPEKPSFFYTTDLETLRKIDRGEMAAMTALGKARGSDKSPMDLGVQEDFQPGPDFFPKVLPFTFHFWTRGFPETVAFDRRHSRVIHGANAVLLYYEKGLRLGWAQMEKGQHVNADPKDQVNPFPTMIIGIRGRGVVRIGGAEKGLEAGQMVFIPAGVSHEAWNPHDEPAEVVLLMFGEGA